MTDKDKEAMLTRKGVLVEGMLNGLEDAYTSIHIVDAFSSVAVSQEVKAYYMEYIQTLRAEWNRLRNELMLLEKETEG